MQVRRQGCLITLPMGFAVNSKIAFDTNYSEKLPKELHIILIENLDFCFRRNEDIKREHP